MPSDPPVRRSRTAPRPVPALDAGAGFDDILTALGRQLGETVEQKSSKGQKLKAVTFEYEEKDPTRTVHHMAGDAGYSIASNWFTQRLAQLSIANSITKSELCVFLYVAGGQDRGIAEYTQQQIADGLNEEAKKTGARCVTRSTVNRAVKALCEYGWLEKRGNGTIGMNVTLWFKGNSVAHKQVLETLAEEKGTGPEVFPNYVGPVSEQLVLPETDAASAVASRRKERTG